MEDELWDLHIQRVKELVHLAITSPLTPTLSRVLAQYPALSTHTTTDFYQVMSFIVENENVGRETGWRKI